MKTLIFALAALSMQAQTTPTPREYVRRRLEGEDGA